MKLNHCCLKQITEYFKILDLRTSSVNCYVYHVLLTKVF